LTGSGTINSIPIWNGTTNLDDSPITYNGTATTINSNVNINGVIEVSEFFSMAPYTGSNPSSPENNNVWFHSGTTGIITLNYRVEGVNYSVELAQ
jgi:hypothetical protein